MQRNFILFTKECKYVSTFCVILSIFFDAYVSPSGKRAVLDTLHPLKISTFKTPSPSQFPLSFMGGRGGGGMDIFWNHTIQIIEEKGFLWIYSK